MLCGLKLFIHSQTSMIAPLKFVNGYVISSHILLCMWLLIYAGIKVKPWWYTEPQVGKCRLCWTSLANGVQFPHVSRVGEYPVLWPKDKLQSICRNIICEPNTSDNKCVYINHVWYIYNLLLDRNIYIHTLWALEIFGVGYIERCQSSVIPDSKVHVAHMGPAWVLSAPGGPHLLCYQGQYGYMSRVTAIWMPQIIPCGYYCFLMVSCTMFMSHPYGHPGTLLLTWINCNPSNA